jgi:hypothetical protein
MSKLVAGDDVGAFDIGMWNWVQSFILLQAI